MEEVLPALQEAAVAQGIEVAVGSDALTSPSRNWLGRIVAFLRDVRSEIHKVTWPTRDEVKKATIVIVLFVTGMGIAIGLMDLLLQFVLVQLVAKLF